jgi:hypothetical protein
MEIWKPTLIDFGVLLVISWGFSLCTFFAEVVYPGKPWSVSYMLFEVTRGAGVGAGSGLFFIEKLGVRAAMTFAVFVSAAVIGRDTIGNVASAVISRIFGVGRANKENPRDESDK